MVLPDGTCSVGLAKLSNENQQSALEGSGHRLSAITLQSGQVVSYRVELCRGVVGEEVQLNLGAIGGEHLLQPEVVGYFERGIAINEHLLLRHNVCRLL